MDADGFTIFVDPPSNGRRDAWHTQASSEIHLHPELEQPRREDRLRHQPRCAVGSVGVVLRQNDVPIEEVVQIHLRMQARPADDKPLRQTKVNLVHAVAVRRARIEQQHGDGSTGAGGEIALEGRYDLRISCGVRR